MANANRNTPKRTTSQIRTSLKRPSTSRSELYDDGGPKKLWAPEQWELVMHELTAKGRPATKQEAIDALNRDGRVPAVSRGLVDWAIKKHKALPWYEPWLLLGAPTPVKVETMNEDQLRACDNAFNYSAILTATPKVLKSTTVRQNGSLASPYNNWFRTPILPYKTFDELVAWTRYHYSGKAPEGWFVIIEDLKTLRRMLSRAGRIRRAEICEDTPSKWDEDDLAALKAAIKWARGGRRTNLSDDPAWAKQFCDPWYYQDAADLPKEKRFRAANSRTAREKKKESILKLANTYNMKETLNEINRNYNWLNKQRALARIACGEKEGKKESLYRFLHSTLPRHPHHDLRGRISNTRIFWPSQVMRGFLGLAVKLWQELTETGVTALPCFDLLMLDRALPCNDTRRHCPDRKLLEERRQTPTSDVESKLTWRQGRLPQPVDEDRKAAILGDRATGMGIIPICRKHHIGTASYYKIIREADGPKSDTAPADCTGETLPLAPDDEKLGTSVPGSAPVPESLEAVIPIGDKIWKFNDAIVTYRGVEKVLTAPILLKLLKQLVSARGIVSASDIRAEAYEGDVSATEENIAGSIDRLRRWLRKNYKLTFQPIEADGSFSWHLSDKMRV